MGKLIGIDYGTKRTGLASTDDLQIIASGLCGISTNELMPYLIKLVEKEKISGFVVGDPAVGSDDKTDSSEAIDKFCGELKKKFPEITLHRVDESYTSREAMSAMVQAGVSKKKRRDKNLLDQVSATLILQRYMESSSY
jgi:putative holliday junction resolvase